MKIPAKVWILAGGALAVLAASMPGSAKVPIYDGVGFPDEPYRYVSRPAGHPATASPSLAFAEASPVKRSSPMQDIASSEVFPQVSVHFSAGAVQVPEAAKKLFFRAMPMAPAGQPADGKIDGNFYRVSVTTEVKGPVIFYATDDPSTVKLRLPQGVNGTPVMEYRPAGGSWTQLNTTRTGTDIYQGNMPGLGDFALVTLKPGARADGQSSSKLPIIIVIVVLAVLAAIIGGVRFYSLKRPE